MGFGAALCLGYSFGVFLGGHVRLQVGFGWVVLGWECILCVRDGRRNQFVPPPRQAIERSERMVGAQHYKGSRRVDLLAAAEREARLAEEREGAAAEAVAGLRVKILVLGMTGACAWVCV